MMGQQRWEAQQDGTEPPGTALRKRQLSYNQACSYMQKLYSLL